MKYSKAIATVVAALLPFGASAQEATYTDASSFPVYGKCIANTSGLYQRLPAAYEGVAREPVWNLGLNSAGIYIRFRSNSTSISVRWETRPHHMPHMTDVGDNGLDLYILTEKDGWRFAGSGFQWGEHDVKTCTIVKDMDPAMREYMLYLPLYSTMTSLGIGVDEGSVLEAPAVASPRSDRPVVMYGSSILQGGCASRPGMAFTSIIGRKLDREVINMGFSGNAKLDLEIAELMAKVKDPAVFVIDNVPNSPVETIRQKGEAFFRILRDAHPDVPVVFVEDPTYPHARFNNSVREEVNSRNAAQHALYRKLKDAGEKGIYYVSTDKLIGDDGEATVDGIHFTDLGMMRYSDKVLPIIGKAMKKAGK